MDKKVIWITGASSGIGEATAYQFAKSGYRLVLSSRREDELLRVKKETGLPDEDVLVLPMDAANYDNFGTLTEKVYAHFGRIDVLYNNAGISQRSFVQETELSVYKRLLDIDLLSVIALTKSVLPIMVKQNSGKIAVTSSVAGHVATPGRSGYAAAKFGLHGFFDALRAEVYKNNIGVTIICPGYIQTDISKNALSSDGTQYGQMDQNQASGMPVEKCAEKIYRAISSGKNEVYIGGKEILGVYIKRFFPKLLAKIVQKQAPK
ncbi:SDR family oxidoreductase [Marinilongibacter aquaticus]|uniref:SDR family oxidoreductase n=1 Tax=Marinilongibacter aquaticus TaxID=2975157 RepID=UPI0021BD419D|nr:SDR family oxidoreductase [Marinilongibacter aquaticus]UBM57865.1 SDR family oxidoreductase [Marinilongibacter aquaticus]